MDYEKEIVAILLEAGRNGLALRKIARHVFNMRNSLFEQLEYEDVHADVQKYIRKNSRDSRSLIRHTAKRGCYRLNKNSEKYISMSEASKGTTAE